MVTGVKAHYFTYLFVTNFSSFWFLGGSDTGLAPFNFYIYSNLPNSL